MRQTCPATTTLLTDMLQKNSTWQILHQIATLKHVAHFFTCEILHQIAQLQNLLQISWVIFILGILRKWNRLQCLVGNKHHWLSSTGVRRLWVGNQSGPWACEWWAVSYKNPSINHNDLFLIWVVGGRFVSQKDGPFLIWVSSWIYFRNTGVVIGTQRVD